MQCKWCQAENRNTARFCATCQASIVDGIPVQDLKSGLRLNQRYEIRKGLGQGAMGAVYGALDTNLGSRRVAIKEYSPARLTNPADQQTAVRMFREEAEMLVKLDHPNMPKISDYFAEGINQYMVMDFIDGATLEQVLEAPPGRVPEAQVIAWGQQIADALRYLHAQNPPIIFRDMKPGNVMVDKQGRVKLIDFGIARTFKPGKAQDTQQFGTPGFAPPEAYGKGQTDARSDVYSLAVTLYVLLSGYDPTSSPFQLPPLRSIMPNVSPNLERAIEVGKQLPMEGRWQTMEQMTVALGAPPARPQYPQAPHYPTAAVPGGHVAVNPHVAGGVKTRGLTQRLAERAAGLSSRQLAALFGGVAVVILALVWFLALPVGRSDLEFDIKYPMLATVGVFAYAAARKFWAPLVTYTPIVITASLVTRVQLQSLYGTFVYADFGTIMFAALLAGGIMAGMAYLQPRIVGKARPEDYTDAEQRLDMVWAILMGFIATIVFTALAHVQSVVWDVWSMYLFGALNGLAGWFAGDFLYRLTIERKAHS